MYYSGCFWKNLIHKKFELSGSGAEKRINRHFQRKERKNRINNNLNILIISRILVKYLKGWLNLIPFWILRLAQTVFLIKSNGGFCCYCARAVRIFKNSEKVRFFVCTKRYTHRLRGLQPVPPFSQQNCITTTLLHQTHASTASQPYFYIYEISQLS